MTDMGEDPGNQPLGGLWREFEEFRTWTDADFVDGLQSGLVAIDTNVLLDLYRFAPDVRSQLVGVLHQLGDRLFIPAQVALEFWRNREGALTDRAQTARAVAEQLDARWQEIEAGVSQWRNRSGGMIDERIVELVASAAETIEKIVGLIEGEASATTHDRATFNDEVLAEIAALADGRVGRPPSEADSKAWDAEAQRRLSEKVPPGYKDSSKGELATGDTVMWLQVLREALHRRPGRILLLTSDQKEDWVRTDGRGAKLGTRRELRREAIDFAAADFAILTPARLLTLASEAFGVAVSETAVAELSAAASGSGRDWDEDNIEEFLSMLHTEDTSRHAVVLAAIANGGCVSRAMVYDLCGFSADRTLRGFTRPTSRIKRELVRLGRLSEGAAEPLAAEYQSPESYVLASGFRVPAQFVTQRQEPEET